VCVVYRTREGGNDSESKEIKEGIERRVGGKGERGGIRILRERGKRGGERLAKNQKCLTGRVHHGLKLHPVSSIIS
jgi:hypothetical protein